LRVTPGGIALALRCGMTETQQLERFCRMWLLAIAVLHWVVFFLLVQTTPSWLTKRSTAVTQTHYASAVATWERVPLR
jgi:hypothetical protein